MSLDRNDTAWIWSALPHVHMYLNSWSPGTGILGSWGSRLLGNRVLDHSSVLLATWSLFYHTHWVVSNMVPHSCLPWYDGLSRRKKLPFRSKDWSSNWSSLRCLFCAFVCQVVVIFRVLILRQIFVLIPLSHPDATSVLHLPCGLCIIFLLLNHPPHSEHCSSFSTAVSFQSLSQQLPFQVLPILCPSKANNGPAQSCVRSCCPSLKTITDWESFSLGCLTLNVLWKEAQPLLVPAINTCLLAEHYNL